MRINGLLLDLTDDEAFDLTSVAAGQLHAAEIGKSLHRYPQPADAQAST